MAHQIPIIITTKQIIDRVMSGEKMTLPVFQFAQFLYEADMDMIECKINCKQVGNMVEMTRWD